MKNIIRFFEFPTDSTSKLDRHGTSWNLDNTDGWNRGQCGWKIERPWHYVQSELEHTGCKGKDRDTM